jgi:hypothetical protein
MSKASAIDQFMDRVTASLEDGTFVQVTVSGSIKSDSTPEKVIARNIDLKGVSHLSLTFRYATRDETKNFPISQGIAWLRRHLPAQFSSALLCSTQRDWQLFAPAGAEPRLISHKPSKTKPPSRSHDQPRQSLLDHSARDWLGGLGVLETSGKVRSGMSDKHQQIHRYVEILSHLGKDCGWGPEGRSSKKSNPPPSTRSSSQRAPLAGTKEGPIEIADMGSGKGYLTFAVWHLFHRVWQTAVHVVGIEARRDLVQTTSQLAKEIDAKGLEFVQANVGSAKLERIDALFALHACDTATDHAIQRGIELGAKLIVVAPCCQKEIRPQIGKPEPLASVLRHGVMKERMAEWLTDGLRALYLEWAGYRTKVFEFIAAEHTPKNLMIAAVRAEPPFASTDLRERIERLKEFFAVKTHALDSLLDQHNASGTPANSAIPEPNGGREP